MCYNTIYSYEQTIKGYAPAATFGVAKDHSSISTPLTSCDELVCKLVLMKSMFAFVHVYFVTLL